MSNMHRKRRKSNGRAKKRKGQPPELARDPDLIQTISRHLKENGLVGEENNGLLVYLAYTSRLLPDPVSVIIRGKSSSGKDVVQRKPAELMPRDEIIEATHLTPQALYYPEDPAMFRHRILIGGERSHRSSEEQADYNAAIRQFISEGRISKLVTIEMKTQHIVVEGPIVFSQTTTQKKVFAEDLNRCLQLHTDESDDQTRQVVLAKADCSGGGSNQLRIDEVRRLHHEFQTWLEPVDICIPYARKLAEALPAERVESRRIITQILSIIKAVALLHQHQRGKDDEGHLIATPVDYAIARQLLSDPLHRSIGIGDSYQKCVQLREKLPNTHFDSNQALKAAFKNKTSRDRALKKLVEVGLLERVAEGSSHKPAQWRWTDKSPDELVLPDVRSVIS